MLRVVTAFLGVVALSSLVFSFPADAKDSLSLRTPVRGAESRVGKGISSGLESLLTSAFPELGGTHGQGDVTPQRPVARKAAFRPDPSVEPAPKRGDRFESEDLYAGTFSSSIGDVIFSGLPHPAVFPEAAAESATRAPLAFRSPALLERNQLDAILMPGDSLSSVGTFPAGPESGFSHLEIEVSHSLHYLKLIGNRYFGPRDVIYECKVGLDRENSPHR